MLVTGATNDEQKLKTLFFKDLCIYQKKQNQLKWEYNHGNFPGDTEQTEIRKWHSIETETPNTKSDRRSFEPQYSFRNVNTECYCVVKEKILTGKVPVSLCAFSSVVENLHWLNVCLSAPARHSLSPVRLSHSSVPASKPPSVVTTSPTMIVPSSQSPSPDSNNNRRQKAIHIHSIRPAAEVTAIQVRGQGQGHVMGDHVRRRLDSGDCDSSFESPLAPPVVEVGFTDLSFADFTTDKFGLIARAFCERHRRRPSSIFFNYTCIDCDRAFPCPSALAVHRNSHLNNGANAVNCNECECLFDNPHQQRLHQIHHASDQVMESFTASTKDKDTDGQIQHHLSKEEFLCSMGLQLAKKEDPPLPAPSGQTSAPRPKIHDAFPRFDHRVNRDYFARFNQINFREFAHIARGFIDVKQEPMEDDFAHIDQILKMTTGNGGGVVPLGGGRHLRAGSPGVLHLRDAYNMDTKGHNSADTFICKFCGDKFDNLRNYKGNRQLYTWEN